MQNLETAIHLFETAKRNKEDVHCFPNSYITANMAVWLKKLKAYEDAEEQGLLVKLPCKVGDAVYTITRFCSGGIRDCDYAYECSECPNYKPKIDYKRFKITMLNSVGKTVFLTREEAERKLGEMEDE